MKLVASIEVEMFDIFRNTDSKYMNKYRTIMFNLKDPRNKVCLQDVLAGSNFKMALLFVDLTDFLLCLQGLLYGFVRGEISPFRLVRMTQKDMQAIKASDATEKQTSEVNAIKAQSINDRRHV